MGWLRQAGVLAAAVVLAAVSQAKAATINVSTGLNSSNVVLTTNGALDAHWIVGQAAGGTAAAQVVAGPPDMSGGWIVNNASSAWIARDASTAAQGIGSYDFSTTFSLTGFDPGTSSISGSWAIDNSGVLKLNGHTIATLGSFLGGALTNFSVLGSSGFFLPGVNTLTMTLTTGTDQGFQDGARLQGTVNAVLPTPLPAGAWAGLSLFGAMGAGSVIRRRSQAKA